MKLVSSDFRDHKNIPPKFTCDGIDVSPQLSWYDVPERVRSFALSMVDPDAPGGTWIHWLLYDIPKEVRGINQGSRPQGAKMVENDFRKKEYGGPCPPSGTHRYVFTIYALDVEHLNAVNKRKFFDEVEKHRLEKVVLTGLYSRT